MFFRAVVPRDFWTPSRFPNEPPSDLLERRDRLFLSKTEPSQATGDFTIDWGITLHEWHMLRYEWHFRC